MDGIKNIIFDLGGVILNIDYNRTVLAFEQLGIATFQTLFSKKQQNDFFDKWETGKMSSVDFIQTIKNEYNLKCSDTDIINAWNSMIIDFPIRRLQILQQLQLHYNIYLLSNTNAIHEEAFNKLLQTTCGLPHIGLLFDKIYLSHRIGLRKPDASVFEFVINDNHLIREETLFIDDSIQHIESANRVGLRTIHIQDNMSIENDIFKLKSV